MTERQRQVLNILYKEDIWEDFKPIPVNDKVQGWNGNHPTLKRVLSNFERPIIVDVGVWKGQSTINMALGLKENGIDGCVIAVDTFLGSPEHWTNNPDWFRREHGRPDLYATFMSNVVKAGVQEFVVPMPQTSVTAAIVLQRSGIFADVVHIDAAHEYEEVIRDAEEYWKITNKGGFLVGDDYHHDWPGVVRAAGEFSAKTFRPLLIESPKWIVQKQ